MAVADQRPDVDPGTRDRVEQIFREAGLAPPDLAAVAAAVAATPEDVQNVVRFSTREGTLVRVGTLVFHMEALAALRRDLQEMKRAAAASTSIEVSTFKQRYGLSRKFAIPLLEWLDRERVTRRVGEKRVIL
jgi:selenocysteine-specific elongation factor